MGAIFKKIHMMSWWHDFAVGSSIWMKLGKSLQNDIPMTISTFRLVPEVEFQYGRRLFLETGSSIMLAMDWDISS